MYYNLQCTYVRMYISDKKKLSKMFQKYSKLCLPGQYAKESRAGQYMTYKTEGQTGDSDLRVHHIPEDFNTWITNIMTLRWSSSCGKDCPGRMLQSEYHKAAE